jgi:3-hydroxyacyl-[acyl-carrier-protein] dehydratase
MSLSVDIAFLCVSSEFDVAGKELFLDPSSYDLNKVIADIEAIRRYNPQRHEMEQLTAIVLDDPEAGVIVGYKDITQDEFWVRGHMPGMPLMPGVVMCEAAAQLCSYFVQKHDMLGVEMVGFGGLTDVRFRDVVPPGNRLVIVARLLKLRRGALILSEFQGLLDDKLVVEGKIKGIPLPVEVIRGESTS